MSSIPHQKPLGQNPWLLYSLAFLGAGLYFLLILSRMDAPYDPDSLFHLKTSESLSRFFWADSFPWMQYATYNTNYADKCLLFHFILWGLQKLPFASAGFLAPALFSAVLFSCTLFVLRSAKVPYIWMFLLLFFALSADFLMRLLMIRPHHLAITLTLLYVHFLCQRRLLPVFIVTLIYAYSYNSYHFLLILAILYALVYGIYYWQMSFEFVTVTLAALLVGIVVHPQFPNNLILWKINTIDVFVNQMVRMDVSLIAELLPPGPRYMLVENALAFFTLPALFLYAQARKVELSFESLYWSSTVFLFFCMTSLSVRFVEYWALFSLVAIAMLIRDILQSPGALLPFWRDEVKVILGVLLASGVLLNLYTVEGYARKYSTVSYRDAALWLADNPQIGEKEIIFHSRWDRFPQLFYYNPKNYYIFGLDPIYLYSFNNQKWVAYYTIVNGAAPNIEDLIRQQFHSRYVLADKNHVNLVEKLRQSKRAKQLYQDNEVTLFEILD